MAEKASAKTPALVSLALLASYGLFLGVSYPSLPERIATHFGVSGEANGWMGRQEFLLFQLGLLAVLGGAFFFLPRALAGMPARWINVPNRDYWLAPEHRPELDVLLTTSMGWMGVLVLGLMVSLLALTVKVNLSPSPRLPVSAAGPLLGLFVAAEVAWFVLFLSRLLRKPEPGP